jgi:hypothetical protein
MTQTPNNPPQWPPPVPPKTDLRRFANRFGDYIRSALVILGWAVVGAAGLGAAWIALRAILWAAGLAQNALGLG